MKFLILITLVSTTLFAESAFEAKQRIFAANWESSAIQENYCGKNAQHLIELWSKAGIKLKGTELWQVTNKGFSYFGLVKYYQNRWSSFSPAPNNPEYLTNGSGGWYYHAFIVSDGYVYDYSYKRVPTVVSVEDYIMDMFVLKEDIGTMSWERRRDGIEMIKKYQIIALRGDDVIKAIKDKLPLSKFENPIGNIVDYSPLGKDIKLTKSPILGINTIQFQNSGQCETLFAEPNRIIIPSLEDLKSGRRYRD